MKKVMIGLLLGLFLVGFVFAANGDQDGTGIMHDAVVAAGGLNGTGVLTDAHGGVVPGMGLASIRERMREGEEMQVGQNGLVIRKVNGEVMEFVNERARVRTELMLSNEGNTTNVQTRLSNGRNAEIKIMPEVASETALARLRLKDCDGTRNCSIELKEVGVGNQTRLAYEAKAEKTFRIFGIFKNREAVMTQIDAETGEEIVSQRPWWAWLASEEDEAEAL